MIYLFYTSSYQQLQAAQLELVLHKLPFAAQEKILRFKNWQDAQRSLLGNMLLLKGMQVVGADNYSLADIKYTNYKKPYFEEGLSFNISHSGAYVVCALSVDNQVGVDIEEVKRIDLQDMQSHFSPQEWSEIIQAKDSMRTFYQHWTQKEAFLKAIGLGLSYSPEKVNFSDSTITWENKKWYCKEVLLDPAYCCHVVTTAQSSELVIEQVHLNQL
ncbi:4'-phosphopantetheinyl transferase family protein [Hymenobacter sp. GOD-10R]|uniref:4'-phosphopantetheinyl transferase family protein n=1 Tax=Hymenobacter sp. GOD-10R TaxID=3093922 RepID=UPI002D7A1EFB|nr:4'-phosphopantetheinyl transferase superfamily protein [Hymenobacter sp. GOD-10R]WRQ27828.1 4'-phosphopantetheinyl transferase superfamily protein [Hymenobacter sp. GOD-10R]